MGNGLRVVAFDIYKSFFDKAFPVFVVINDAQETFPDGAWIQRIDHAGCIACNLGHR